MIIGLKLTLFTTVVLATFAHVICKTTMTVTDLPNMDKLTMAVTDLPNMDKLTMAVTDLPNMDKLTMAVTDLPNMDKLTMAVTTLKPLVESTFATELPVVSTESMTEISVIPDGMSTEILSTETVDTLAMSTMVEIPETTTSEMATKPDIMSTEIYSTEIMDTPKTSTMTKIPETTTSEMPMKPVIDDKCPAGWENCGDGQCEPFHWLCTEHDGSVTIVPPPEHKTLASTTTQKYTDSTSQTLLGIVTDSVQVNTMGVVSGTDQQGYCPQGWEQCEDGTCESFHWLCIEHGGPAVTIVPPPVHANITTTTAPVSGVTMDTTDTSATLMSTTTVFMSTAEPTTVTIRPLTTDETGKCREGWALCSDGVCEPFHWLCSDQDGNNTVTMNVTTTDTPVSSVTMDTTDITMTGVTMDTTEAKATHLSTLPPTTTTTTTVFMTTVEPTTVTIRPLTTDETGKCREGWALCSDGVCEPFHWLCSEQDGNGNVLVGR